MKFRCITCKKEIKSISIVKTLTYRVDFEIKKGIFTEVDKEYLDPGTVHSIIYECDCHPNGIEWTHRFDTNIKDFIRDSHVIFERDIKSGAYGNLEVIKGE